MKKKKKKLASMIIQINKEMFRKLAIEITLISCK